jgi:hypothetical protein
MADIDLKFLEDYAKNAEKRKAELTAMQEKYAKEQSAKQVSASGKSTDIANRLPGETASQANARITQAYKDLQAKPVLSQEQIDAGAKVRYVRTGAGGVGEYTVVTPLGYTGPTVTKTFTEGILRSDLFYTTVNGQGGTKVSSNPVVGTPTGGKVNTLPNGSYTIVSRVKRADGGYDVTYKAADGTLYTKTEYSELGDGSSSGSGSSGGGGNAPSTNIDVLKAMLRGRGFNAALIDSSASYLQDLLKDGLDYDNAVEIFLSSKDYTLKNGSKITSPFYEAYGYLNESAPKPLGANELYGFVEGTKSLVKKYGLNSKFASTEYMKKYISNAINVDDLEARANTARLKALESDTSYVEALKKLGFVSTAADLTDFFLDPNVGQETLIQNQRMGTFAAEAIRRASAGIEFNKTLAQQMAASYTAKGLNEAQISAAAAQGYQSIAESLQPTTKLSGIYDKTAAVGQSQIQTELEQEEFMGMESARRKRLKETELKAYQGQSGTTQYSLRGQATTGIL